MASLILDLISNRQEGHVKSYLDGIFEDGDGPSGMRISVYCSDQSAYHSEAVLHEVYQVYPWMQGYHINDVYREICDCWQVPPISPRTKQPFYSEKPALLADGEMDNACRPLYIDLIHHYMPNSQRLLFIHFPHMVGGKEWHDDMVKFLNNPYQKIASGGPDIIAY
jgi:hypothetical protein